PREVPGALAFASGVLYLASGPRLITKHMLDARLSTLGRSKVDSPQLVGMAYDGLYLWTVDAARGRLVKRVLDSELTPAASFDYPGVRPAALAFDGKELWSLDAGGRELLRHDLDDPRRVTLRLPLHELDSGEWSPVGLAFDGRRFLVAATKGKDNEAQGRLFANAVPPALLAAMREK
ncbi:MAG: hypothetical protein KGL53_11355, partial [Elusimicrobia bacterium]|nr:hypothetical protein [Elusimicrobiota bacterium]